jgi:hypothetical protein
VILHAKEQTAAATDAAFAVFPPADGRIKLQPFFARRLIIIVQYSIIYCLHADAQLPNLSAVLFLEPSKFAQHRASKRANTISQSIVSNIRDPELV